MTGPATDARIMRRLGAAALLMTSAVFVSRLIGYLREAFVAARFGASATTDAFYAAFTLPDWLNYLVAGGTLSITLLPIYARLLAEGDEREANRVLSIVTTLVVAFVLSGVVALEVFARPISAAYFNKLDGPALAACVHYTRILLPAQLCFVVGGILQATLFARGRFIAAALAPIIYNAGIIVGGVVLGDRLGPASLAWGALAGAFAGPLLVPAVDALRHGARVWPSFAARHPGFIEWIKLSLPLMIGVSLVTADDWIIRYFAGGEVGDITRLNYAKRLVAVPIAVAGQAVGQASMPFFARLFAEGKRDELADTFLRTVRGTAIVSMLIAAWMIGLGEPLVRILFARGRFGTRDVGPTATYLAIFAAAVPLWAVQGLAARVFYAARNTLTPMIAGTIVTALSLPVYALAHRAGGGAGLALASGIGILCHTVAILVWAPRLLPELGRGGARTAAAVLRGALLAAVAGAACRAAARPLVGPDLVHALAAAAAGSAAFLVVVGFLAARFGIDEPRRLWLRLRRRRSAA